MASEIIAEQKKIIEMLLVTLIAFATAGMMRSIYESSYRVHRD